MVAYDFKVSFAGKVLPQKIPGSQQFEYRNDVSGDGRVGPLHLYAFHEYSRNHQQVTNKEVGFQYQNNIVLVRVRNSIGGGEIIFSTPPSEDKIEKESNFYHFRIVRLLEGIYQKDESAILQRFGDNKAGNFEDIKRASLTIYNSAYSQGRFTFHGKVTIHVDYPATQAADLKIASLDMVGPHTLRVNLKGETAKRRDPVKITTTINGRHIDFTGKPKEPSVVDAGLYGADGALDIDFENGRPEEGKWSVPRFTADVRFKVTASVPNTQVTDTKGSGLRLPIIFVPGIDPVGGIVPQGNAPLGRYPGFDKLIDRIVSESLNSGVYLPYNPDLSGSGNNEAVDAYKNIFRLDYLRNRASFDEGAQYLNDQWSNVYSKKCWADKFNIVSHSKGTLVTRAMLSNKNLDTYNRASKVVLIQGPHLGSLSPIYDVLGSGIVLYSDYQMLLPLWTWQSDDGKVFTIPDNYKNPALAALNQRLMNPAPLYKVVYSDTWPTNWRHVGKFYNQPEGTGRNTSGLQKWGGDTIVPSFSQLGIMPGTGMLGFPGGKLGKIAPDQPILPFADLQRRGRLSNDKIAATHVTVDNDPNIVRILQEFFNQP